MHILFITSYYPPYLNSLYNKYNYFNDFSYTECINIIVNECFADTGSAYEYAKKQGNEASIVIQNAEIIQKKWAKENNISYKDDNWFEEIELEQVKKIKPDVFYTDAINSHSTKFLKEVSNYCKASAAWISFPFSNLPNLSSIKLILTSTNDFKKQFNSKGIKSEYLLPAFNSAILSRLKNEQKNIPFSFIGGISDLHKNRWEALNFLCKNTDIKLWGYGIPNLPSNPFKKWFAKDIYKDIRMKHQGEAWALDMYQLLKNSLITFNIHEELLKGDVGNMRMFEATGVGTMILNDYGSNLSSLFEIDKEIVTYNSMSEATEKLNYYLQYPDKAIEIGLNAQKRTIKDYTYDSHVFQLISHFKKIL